MVDIIPIEVLRGHCRSAASDDAMVSFYFAAAVAEVEKRTGLALAPIEVTDILDAWPRLPGRLSATLSRWPVTAVAGISYLDTDSAAQDLDASLWRTALAARPGKIIFSSAQLPRLAGADAITISYTAGYADPADIPANVKQAALVLLAEYFGNREAGAISEDAERAVSWLLRHDRRRTL